MAIYRGMDIGTAKPSREQRGRRAASPDRHRRSGRGVQRRPIRRCGRRAPSPTSAPAAREPLFVGGTPLYLKSLLRGLFDGPPADWQLRHEIEEELAHVGQQALYDRLAASRSRGRSHIHPHDTRRLIRALEVYRATGEPISHQQLQFDEGRPADECRVFVLRRRREELHARIEGRVEAMINAGLVDEVRPLTSDGRELGRTARQAVGYREALAYLAGEYDHDEMIARIKARTRRFAKRQGTWFRSLSECRFVDIAGEVDADAVAEAIARDGARRAARLRRRLNERPRDRDLRCWQGSSRVAGSATAFEPSCCW